MLEWAYAPLNWHTHNFFFFFFYFTHQNSQILPKTLIGSGGTHIIILGGELGIKRKF